MTLMLFCVQLNVRMYSGGNVFLTLAYCVTCQHTVLAYINVGIYSTYPLTLN